MILAALDIASSELRAVVLNTDSGRIVGSANRPLEISGHDTYLSNLGHLGKQALEDAVSSASLSRSVDSVCVTATSGSMIALDRHGQGVGEGAAYWRRESEDLTDHRSNPLSAEHPALARAIERATAAGTRKFGSFADAINSALVGGTVSSDSSHMLKVGVEPGTNDWSAQALASFTKYRIDPPDLVSPGTVLGEVRTTKEPMLNGAVLIAGSTDGCTSHLATGFVEPGDYVGTIGTTYVAKVVAEYPLTSSQLGIYSHQVLPGYFLAGGASNAGAGVLSRFTQSSQDMRQALASAQSVLEPSWICYPLTRPRERFPRGVIPQALTLTALSVDAALTPAQQIRAAIEGIAFVERASVECLTRVGASVGRRIAVGGATRTEWLNVLRATVLQTELLVSESANSAVGAALLAAHSLDSRVYSELIEKRQAECRLVHPDPDAFVGIAERWLHFSQNFIISS